jgi:hypothetical protein
VNADDAKIVGAKYFSPIIDRAKANDTKMVGAKYFSPIIDRAKNILPLRKNYENK